MSSIGDKLIAYRRSAGLSQMELSEVSGVSQTAISYIEVGRNKPTVSTAAKLANALRIPVQDLIGYPENKKMPATQAGDGLVESIRQMVLDLPEEDRLKVYGFVAGLQSARSKTEARLR